MATITACTNHNHDTVEVQQAVCNTATSKPQSRSNSGAVKILPVIRWDEPEQELPNIANLCKAAGGVKHGGVGVGVGCAGVAEQIQQKEAECLPRPLVSNLVVC